MTMPAPAGAYGAADPIFLVLAALAVEAYLGALPAIFCRLPHPRGLLARLAAGLNRRLNRPGRGRRPLLLRGVFATLAMVAAGLAGGLLLALVTRNYPFAWVVELFLLITLLPQRATWDAAGALAAALEARSEELARDRLRQLAGEGIPAAAIEQFDARALALAGLEGLARRFAQAVVAPVFWYLLGGLPGLFVYLAARAGAAVFAPVAGHSGAAVVEERANFGLTAACLARALAWLPEKLAAVILALAALFVPGGRPLLAFKRLRGARFWPVAAVGGALGLAAYADSRPARAAAADSLTLRRGQLLLAAACLIHAGLLAALALVRIAL